MVILTKRVISIAILFTITLYSYTAFTGLAADAKQDKENKSQATQKIISLVYDDSSSMSWQGNSSWSEVNYATQLLYGMLNENDIFYITYMSDAIVSTPYEVKTDRQEVVDEIREHLEEGDTPLKTIETAYNTLFSTNTQDNNAEYWLVMLTDGGFKIDSQGGNTLAKKQFLSMIEQYTNTAMPNGSKINIAYLALGSEAYEIESNPDKNINSYKCINDEIIPVMSKVSSMILGEYQFNKKSNAIKFVDDKTIELTINLPFFDFTIIAQNTDASIKNVTDVSTGEKLNANVSISARAPVAQSKISNTSLKGSLAQFSKENEFINPGTYRIVFDGKYNKDAIDVLGAPAVEIGIDVQKSDINEVIDDLNKCFSENKVDINATPYIYGTNTVADLSLLEEDITYSLRYYIKSEIFASNSFEKMQLNNINLQAENSEIRAEIILGNCGALSKSIYFKPQKFHIYEIVPIGITKKIPRNKLNNNTQGITFKVYKDDEIITDISELIKLNISYDINSWILRTDYEFCRDGSIYCVPRFGSSDKLIATLTNWLSTWCVFPSQKCITASFKTVYSNDAVSASSNVLIGIENIFTLILNLLIPFMLLFFIVGFYKKMRFQGKSYALYITLDKKDGKLNSLTNKWERITLSESKLIPMSIYSFIPYMKNKVKAHGLIFTAIAEDAVSVSGKFISAKEVQNADAVCNDYVCIRMDKLELRLLEKEEKEFVMFYNTTNLIDVNDGTSVIIKIFGGHK